MSVGAATGRQRLSLHKPDRSGAIRDGLLNTRGKQMRYGSAIALTGLMAGLVGLAPQKVFSLPSEQKIAQTAQDQKSEADRLLQRGIQLGREGIKLRAPRIKDSLKRI